MGESNPNKQGQVTIFRSNAILVGGVVFSIILGWLTYKALLRTLDMSSGGTILSVTIILACLFVCIRSLYLLFFKKPLLVLTPEALYVNKIGKIPWRDIEKIAAEPTLGSGLFFIERTYVFHIHLKTGKKILLNTIFYPITSGELIKLFLPYL